MIIKPLFNFYRASECAQFVSDAVSICSKKDITALGIEKQVNDLSESATKLITSLNLKQGNAITTSINNADNRRDSAFTCFRTMTIAFTNHFDSRKRNVASELLETIDNFGSQITKLNYQAETSTIDALCSRIDSSTDLTTHVEFLGMTDILNEIKSANTQFNATYLSRVEDEASKQGKTASELTKESITLYRALENHINAHQVLNSSEEFTTIVNELNQLIEKYNATIDARISKEKVTEEVLEQQ